MSVFTPSVPLGPMSSPSSPSRAVSALTITVDLPSGLVTPRTARLVELLGELVETGEGTVQVAGRGRPVSGELFSAPPNGRQGATARDGVAADPDTLVLSLGARDARLGARLVDLTRIEFDLLVFLAEHPRQVFTRLQLLTDVWGHRCSASRTVDVHVRRIRAKVGARTPLVTTVHGVGYRLADEARILIRRGR